MSQEKSDINSGKSSITTSAEENEEVIQNIAKSNRSTVKENEAELAKSYGIKSSIDVNPVGAQKAETSNSYQPDISWSKPEELPKEKGKRGGLADTISDELRTLPGGKLPANVLDKVSNFMANSPLLNKVVDKVRTLPGGDATVNVLSKAYGTVTSKPVLRTIKAASAIVSMVNFPIGTVAGGLSLAAIGGNVLKETLDVREIQRLDVKKKNLQNIKDSKQTQTDFIDKNKKTIGKDSPELQEFLESKKPKQNPFLKPSPNISFEGSKLKEFGKAVRDSTLAATSLILTAVEAGNPVGIVAAAATGVVNASKEADGNLVRRKKINDKKNEINNLNQSVEPYKNSKELKERERQERIKVKTLEEFLLTPDINKLSKEELDHIYNVKKREIEDREKPPEKTKIQKVKSAVKAGASYFAESQFGDLKELYKKPMERQPYVAPSRPNKVQEPEKSKANEKVQQQTKDKVRDMKEELTHGQVKAYSSSRSALPTPNAKHHESSTGRGG